LDIIFTPNLIENRFVWWANTQVRPYGLWDVQMQFERIAESGLSERPSTEHWIKLNGLEISLDEYG